MMQIIPRKRRDIALRIEGIFLFLILSFSISFGQRNNLLDSLLQSEIDAGSTPAMAIAVIKSGELVHLNTYGLKDLDKQIPVSKDDAFHIASVSKVITSLAVFKLVEEGKVSLTDDINKHLKFKVRNNDSRDIITIADLLNHRSGLADDMQIYEPYWNDAQGDTEIALGKFLRDYLCEGGALFNESHFTKNKPGKTFQYSNTGYALLGLLVESISKMSFNTFCAKYIFEPLSMNNTAWFLKDFDEGDVVKTYVKTNDHFVFNGHNGYPDYPAGQLRSSISDLARLFVAYLNAEDGSFILSKETTQTLSPSPTYAPGVSYTWFRQNLNGRQYYSHEGRDIGVRARVVINPDKKDGIILFTNSEFWLGKLLRNIESLTKPRHSPVE